MEWNLDPISTDGLYELFMRERAKLQRVIDGEREEREEQRILIYQTDSDESGIEFEDE